MKLTLGSSKFKIRFLYKSGNSHSQWFTSFTTVQDLTRAEWTTAHPNIKPIVMGLDDLEAVWQEDYRVNLFYFLWVNTFGALLKLGR